MAAHERGLDMMGKPVFLHVNGDSFRRKRVVVNKREMRNFDSFLNAAANSLRMPAREIRTPAGRHRITTLDDLQRDCTYVVVGREPFKKVGYEGKEIKPSRLAPAKLPEVNFLQLNHRKFGNIPGRARISGLRKKEEIKTIIVFCNGIVAKPKRVQLRTDFKMYQVLESVNDKVSTLSKYGAVYDLFTLDGHKISEPSQLDDNGQYVAVGRERYFDRSVPYNDQGVAAQLTPRRASNRPKLTEIKPHRKPRGGGKRKAKKKSLVPDDNELNKRLPADLDLRDDNDDNGNSSPRSVKETEPTWRFEETLESVRDEGLIPDRIEEPLRTYAAKAREDSLQEQDIEDIPLDEPIKEEVADVLGDNGVPLDDLINEKQDGSVDGGRASQGRSSRDQEQQEDQEVKPSVYEASGEERIDAREIQDDKETVEDKPIDQMPAEEVADEEIEENNDNREDAEQESNDRQAEEVQEEEIEDSKETSQKDNEPEEEIEDNKETIEKDNEPEEEIEDNKETNEKDSEPVAQKEGTFVKSQSSLHRIRRQKKVKPSVYEASGEERIDAREIQDDKETVEDKPIDQMPAEEVADEEIEENNDNREDAEQESNDRQAEEVQEEEIEDSKETSQKDNEPEEEIEDNKETIEKDNEPEEEIEDNKETNEKDSEPAPPEENERSKAETPLQENDSSESQQWK